MQEESVRTEQIGRITRMEEILDEAQREIEVFRAALARFAAVQDRIDELSAYYGSNEWRADFAADEAGELPAGLKRGVLSEDAVYDLLMDDHDLLFDMMQFGARGDLTP